MKLHELSPALGGEVVDLDLTQPISPEDAAELRAAFRERHLLLVRNQDLTSDQQIAFVSLFGTLRRPNKDGTQFAFISNVLQTGLAGQNPLLFHSDGSFFEHPVWGLSLYAQEVYDTSPTTVWANAVHAASNLPTELRTEVEELDAVFIQDLSDEDEGHRVKEADIPTGADRRRYARAVHPAILKEYAGLPPVLYTNQLQTSHFERLAPAASEELLQRLLKIVYDEDNMYEHHWKPNDLIVWNNVALQHGRPPHEGEMKPRTLRRVVLAAP